MTAAGAISGGGRAALVAGLWLAAAQLAGAEPPTGELARAIAERGLDPETLIDPTHTTEEMRRWVRDRVPAEGEPEGRLKMVLAALLLEDGLKVRYDRERTGTAREVFESGLANCLSFTHLFVALAREVGLDAYYAEIERQPRFDQEGDLVLVWEHVTAGFGPEERPIVLEFAAVGESVEGGFARRLSDLTALAMYYSNVGASSIREGEIERALEGLEIAVRLDPEWSQGWLNLGVARRRAGDEAGAEAAYRRSIEVDGSNLQAYYNLAGLYRLQGQADASGRILRLLDRRDHGDPFIYLALGDSSLEAGELESARRFYRRALGLAPEQPEVRAAMGLWALAAGRDKRARSWLERAEREGAGGDRVATLRRRLEAGGAADG